MRYLFALSAISVFLGSGCMAKSPTDDSREHVVAGMTLILKSWDKDGDSKLSRAEVQGMVEESFRRIAKGAPGGKMTADLDKQQQELLGFYASQDTNHDGYLTLDELLTGPLANFECEDANHDSKVSREELFSGMERCPSVNLEEYAPKP
ncbi:MAG: hypothetical protein ABIQ32_09075 [Sphingomicrobium sp.]